MSSVRQHSIYFVPVFFLLCAFAPATEGMGAFLLRLHDRIPVEVYFMVTILNSARKIGEGAHRPRKLWFSRTSAI